MVALPLQTLPQADTQESLFENGGFLPITQLASTAKGAANANNQSALISQMLLHALATQQIPSGELNTQPANSTQAKPTGPLTDLSTLLQYAPALAKALSSFGSQGLAGQMLTQAGAMQMLATAGRQLGSMAIQDVMNMEWQEIAAKLFATTDSDGMGKQLGMMAAHEIADQLVGLGEAELLKMVPFFGSGASNPIDKFKLMLSGTPEGVATANFNAIRQNDKDLKGNTVTAGLPTVLVEGMPLARINDPMDKSGISVKTGAPRIAAGGPLLFAACIDSQSGAGVNFAPGANSVFLHGPCASPPSIPAGVNYNPGTHGFSADNKESGKSAISAAMKEGDGQHIAIVAVNHDGGVSVFDSPDDPLHQFDHVFAVYGNPDNPTVLEMNPATNPQDALDGLSRNLGSPNDLRALDAILSQSGTNNIEAIPFEGLSPQQQNDFIQAMTEGSGPEKFYSILSANGDVCSTLIINAAHRANIPLEINSSPLGILNIIMPSTLIKIIENRNKTAL
jgi:hypothetical protein